MTTLLLAFALALGQHGVGNVRLSNGGEPYAGDSKLLTTISPDGDGYRDRAHITFSTASRGTVRLTIGRVGVQRARIYTRVLRVGAGRHAVVWEPGAKTRAQTYVVRLNGRRAGVVRILGIEVTATRTSYRPQTSAVLRVATDKRPLTLQLFHIGAGPRVGSDDAPTRGVAVTDPVVVRGRSRAGPFALRVWVGDWPSGLYAARFTAGDGSTGYAPFIVRPRFLGEHRVAVVLPTYTWQAYNFRDTDGNGFGDTWYEGRSRQTRLGRPFAAPGLPSHFHAYDLNFLVWLSRRHSADFVGDEDLSALPGSYDLAQDFDLIVFPGHHEYVTAREFSLVRRYRNHGGNLMFLSANNFYWKVVRHGETLTRVARWRSIGQPEAALIGVQYVGNDRGQHKGPFVVRDVTRAPWLFADTGLTTGSTFGVYGIEIDATASNSPPETLVLAEIPHLLGRRTAQMTYYETDGGAKVFAAGAFTLGGNATHVPVATLLENLWSRLSAP